MIGALERFENPLGCWPAGLPGDAMVQVQLIDDCIIQTRARYVDWITAKGWMRVDGWIDPGATIVEQRKHSHYFRSVEGLKEIDVYRLLELFGVTDQAIGHAIKKLLLPGLRGVKPPEKDVQEAIDTLNRWLEMRAEDKARGA